MSDRTTARLWRAPTVAGMRFEFPARAGAPDGASAPSVTSAEVLAQKKPPSVLRRAARRVDQLVGVASWTPFVGSLPPPPGTPGSPPFLIGAAGTLR